MKAHVEQHLATLESHLRNVRERVEAGETVTLDHLDATVQAVVGGAASLGTDELAELRPRVDAIMSAYQALHETITGQLDDIQHRLHSQQHRAHGVRAYEQWQNTGGTAGGA